MEVPWVNGITTQGKCVIYMCIPGLNLDIYKKDNVSCIIIIHVVYCIVSDQYITASINTINTTTLSTNILPNKK